ncbi:plasmid transfer ATPase TraJ [Salmonella enterica subsp. enterica serovar Takoradi]|nr:plasmid transfer ATPase TraJ [Salmonella enterica subsp. enterica serovar Takoradi]
MNTPPFPYNFEMGEISPDDLKRFIVHCSRNNVSDISIQGNDYIWVEQHGRQIQASKVKLADSTLKELIGQVWGADIPPIVVSGDDLDRDLSITGDKYDLERNKTIRLRSNFIQANVGKNLTISITNRIIPSENPTLEKYPIEEEFKTELFPRDGIIVFGGPTGSGKTTSLTACYMYIGTNYPDRKVVTYEQPIEFFLGGPDWIGLKPAQSEIGRDIASFSDGIRNAMRRTPKVIGVGEARDHQTYSAAIEAGKSGHLVYFTIHIDKVGELFSRITQAFPVEQQASIAFDLLSKIRVVMVQNLFKSTDGKRVLVREGLVFTQEIKNELELLHHSKWSRWVEDYMNKNKCSIIDKLWNLYLEGTVSKEEFVSKASYHEFKKRSDTEVTNV